ncbi:unnamed protein product [Allacma fusca]|uniref:Uncharacterized protein n=1 Tax=Allacma fusca TaxID=39272 RepID=A0A8J2LQD3_9HEXA|nr:unnamed protein product [Allacma fusca]
MANNHQTCNLIFNNNLSNSNNCSASSCALPSTSSHSAVDCQQCPLAAGSGNVENTSNSNLTLFSSHYPTSFGHNHHQTNPSPNVHLLFANSLQHHPPSNYHNHNHLSKSISNSTLSLNETSSSIKCGHSSLNTTGGSLNLSPIGSPTPVICGSPCNGGHLCLSSPPGCNSSGQGSPLTSTSKDQLRQLFEACKTGDIVKVKQLSNNRNVNARDTCIGNSLRKSTCLHFASGYGRKDVVEHLLTLGASINARDEGGLTCLHNAASFGHSEVVRLLLSKGADVNARDNWKYTPLIEASSKGKIDVCIALLQNGADPTIRNSDGKTAFDLADPSSTAAVFTGEYMKHQLLEAARSGNEER